MHLFVLFTIYWNLTEPPCYPDRILNRRYMNKGINFIGKRVRGYNLCFDSDGYCLIVKMKGDVDYKKRTKQILIHLNPVELEKINSQFSKTTCRTITE